MAANAIAKLFPISGGSGDLTVAGTTALKAATAAGTIIRTIMASNHGATNETVSFYIHTSSSFTSAHLAKRTIMAPGDSLEFKGYMNLNSGESLWATTTTATTVSCQVHGMDMT